MSDLYKSNPNDLAADLLTDVYTCPPSRTARISVVFANRTAVATTIRLAVAPDGAADAVGHYLLYDSELPANGSIFVDEISIQASDVVRARAADSGVSVNVFINEVGESFI